jgi:hypothetical protein
MINLATAPKPLRKAGSRDLACRAYNTHLHNEGKLFLSSARRGLGRIATRAVIALGL